MKTWFSPFPHVSRGGDEALKELADLDKDISHLETMVSEMREQRRKARNLKAPTPAGGKPASELHSEYLTIVENQRRAVKEVRNLLKERLVLVLRADLAFQPDRRGDYFPFSTVEEKAKEFLQIYRNRLNVVTTVAFFGAGITFSAIFSATRGSIGLMSFSWASFTVSFSVCVYLQYASPEALPLSIVAYPERPPKMSFITLFAGFASFVGIVLMGIAVAMLDLRKKNSATEVDTTINTLWGGVLSLLPVLVGFIGGILNILFHIVAVGQIWRQRNGVIRNP